MLPAGYATGFSVDEIENATTFAHRPIVRAMRTAAAARRAANARRPRWQAAAVNHALAAAHQRQGVLQP